nr:hypothetical protein BaRGS_019645 [Batillaria attramentaria]
MATAASVQPSETECSVCHENFTTPKILPCAHLLCRHCLVTWLKSETDAQCPLCRYAIVDPKDKASKSLDDIADSLPTDLAMEARVECAAILSKDHMCGGCRNSPVKCTCLTCGEMLCTGCTTYHKNFLISRHHKVEDLATMTAERLASSRQLACFVHADKTSELYCPTHGAAICHLCATSKHRACPEVTELEEKMQEARAVLAELAATLKAGESKLEGAISELDQYLVDVEKTTQVVLADIDRKCDRLESSVKKCRQRLKELAKGANSEARRRAEEVKSCLLKRRGRVTSHWRLVDRVGDRMPRACGVSNLTSTLRDRVQGIDLSVTLPAAMKSVTQLSLQIDEKDIASIEQQLSKLGSPRKVKLYNKNHNR